MGDNNGAFEWELSKENVLPLKTGRDCTKLNAALQPHTIDQQTKLKAERHEFELELRTYTGDDPLDVWDRYIRWIEKTFPSRGVGGNFADIVQGCLKQFHDDPRYKNDRRFICWWIEFANLCDEPLEIFNFMFDKGLGSELSCFYEAWASSLEEAGNYKKAEAIYQEGYKRVCEPPDGLLAKFQEFQIRVARGNLGHQEEKMDETEGRSVLGDLKPIGKKHHVGTNRTGLYKQASKGGLSCRPVPLQTQNKRHEVYNEENEGPSLLPPQTGQWKTLPSRKQSNIENTLQPGPWNKAKLSQRTGSASSVVGQPNFTIHVEDDCAFVTPRKGVIDEHVLSARKHKESDPLAAMRINSDSCSVNQVPAYMKSKIYQGSEEFCFEELRAARYIKKKREQEKILEEQRRIEAEKKQLAQMREELGNYHQAIREELKQEREKLMQDLQSKLQINNGSDSVIGHSHNVSHHTQAATIDNDSIVINPQQFTIHTDSISQPPPPLVQRENKPALKLRPSTSDGQLSSGSGSVENTREQPVTKQLNFDDITTGLTENVGLVVQQTITNASNTKSNPNVSHNNSQQTPNLSISSTSMHSGGARPQTTPDSEGSFYKKRGLTAPSPTVHTQEAFQVVMGMFNCSLHTSDNQFGWTEQEQIEGVEEAPKEEAPFKVFDENSESAAHQTAAAAAFPIYVDKENRQYEVPLESKSKRKGLSDIGEVNLPLQTRDLPKPTICENYQANNFVIYEEKMEDVDADFTMATSGFNSTSRLASTPYNLSANVNKLFAPPLSTIKPTEQINISMESIHPAEVNYESNKSTFQQQEKTLDVRMNTPKKNLSPIMEGSTEGGSSDESKSQASSLASKNYSHRLPSVDESHTFPNGRSILKSNSQRLPSVEENQPEFQAPASHKLKFSMSESTAKLPESSVNCEPPKNDNSVTNISNAGHVFNSTEDSLPLPPETMPICQHVIDTSYYVPQELDEKTEAILLTAVNIDPFSNETINDILSKLPVPIKEDPSFLDCSYLPVPEMKAKNFIDMGGDMYHIKRCIGEGGYAKIFVCIPALQDSFCDDTVDIPDVVLKVQKPSCPWEYYICRQIEQRLKALQEPFDISPSIVTVKKGYFFDNGSCLLQDYFSEGTLLDLINIIKRQHRLMSELEPFAAYVTIEILHIMEKLHKCQIIHGDIKPDNFLVDKIPDIKASNNKSEVFGNKTRFLKLIDFGQGIDMTKFPKKTVFLSKVNTDGFKCIEMQTDQPWTYQTDLFGLVGTIHVLIFGKYMNVYQSKGKWLIASSFVRKWNQPLWKELFHTLLNIPSCEDLPNLVELRTKFEDFFMSELMGQYNSLASTLRKEKSMKK